MNEAKVTLHLDASPESELLKRAIIRAKIPFRAVYEMNDGHVAWKLPAIEGPMGIVYGWSNIKAYFDLPID